MQATHQFAAVVHQCGKGPDGAPVWWEVGLSDVRDDWVHVDIFTPPSKDADRSPSSAGSVSRGLALVAWSERDGRVDELFEIVIADQSFRWKLRSPRFAVLYKRGETHNALGFFLESEETATSISEFIGNTIAALPAEPSPTSSPVMPSLNSFVRPRSVQLSGGAATATTAAATAVPPTSALFSPSTIATSSASTRSSTLTSTPPTATSSASALAPSSIDPPAASPAASAATSVPPPQPSPGSSRAPPLLSAGSAPPTPAVRRAPPPLSASSSSPPAATPASPSPSASASPAASGSPSELGSAAPDVGSSSSGHPAATAAAELSVGSDPDSSPVGTTAPLPGPSTDWPADAVPWNATLCSHTDVPPSWRTSPQFGLPLEACELAPVKSYGGVPTVLLMLQEQFASLDGFTTEGVFRVAPGRAKNDEVKSEIQAGTFSAADSPHTAANLVKVWFRELKPNLLNVCTEAQVALASDAGEVGVGKLLSTLKQPHQALAFWLLDFLADVVEHSETKMTPQNLAIVFAPNLYEVTAVNPMAAMTLSQKIVQFTAKAIAWWISTHRS